MGRLRLQMLGHHFRDPQPAVSPGQSAAHRLHCDSVKLIPARVGVGVLIGSRNRSERLLGLLQPVRQQDRLKLARRFLDLGRVPRVRLFKLFAACVPRTSDRLTAGGTMPIELTIPPTELAARPPL